MSPEEIIPVNSSSMQRWRNLPGCAQGPSMISCLRRLGRSLHKDCFTLQMLTWSGSTEVSSFGLNVTAVLEVQPGHSWGLEQTSMMFTTPAVPFSTEPASTMGLLTSTVAEPSTGHRSAPLGWDPDTPDWLCPSACSSTCRIAQPGCPCALRTSGRQPRHGHGLAEHKQGLEAGAGFLEQARSWLIWLCFSHALLPACIWVAAMSCQAQDEHLEHLSLPAKLCLFSISVSGSMSPWCHSNAISYINHPPPRNDNPAHLQISLFIEINKGENTWH